MVHKLKIDKRYFEKILDGSKTFEIRKNDRNYQQGDILILKEWNNYTGRHTGRELTKIVTYIFRGGSYGVKEGYCVMGIQELTDLLTTT